MCREGTADEQACLRRVFSLTVAYNAGALPCDCHWLGSVVDGSCSSHGGRCRCKNGTAGRRCDRCDTRHYALSDTGCTRTRTRSRFRFLKLLLAH